MNTSSDSPKGSITRQSGVRIKRSHNSDTTITVPQFVNKNALREAFDIMIEESGTKQDVDMKRLEELLGEVPRRNVASSTNEKGMVNIAQLLQGMTQTQLLNDLDNFMVSYQNTDYAQTQPETDYVLSRNDYDGYLGGNLEEESKSQN